MPIEIVRNDITKMQVDAIVNATDESLSGGGGADAGIHRAAGLGLKEACMKLGGCKIGEAKITEAYLLPCRYVIHTVGPRWHDGMSGEREKLASCYRECLKLAKEQSCETVAFPLISSGTYRFPKDMALRVAIDTVSEFLMDCEMKVYIVVFDREAFRISSKLFSDISEYIDDHYVDEQRFYRRTECSIMYGGLPRSANRRGMEDMCKAAVPMPAEAIPVENMSGAEAENTEPGLDFLLEHLDAGFSETLMKLIDRSGKKDSEIYKRANIDRKLFSKIRNNPQYRPSKPTALAFAIALELDMDDTRDFIARAGYALSQSSKFDVIIEYFIERKRYNIFEINEVLFSFEQSLLGA